MTSWYFDGYISKIRVQTESSMDGVRTRSISLKITPSNEYRHVEVDGNVVTEKVLLVCDDSNNSTAKLLPTENLFVVVNINQQPFLNDISFLILKVQHAKVRFYVAAERMDQGRVNLIGCDIP